MASRSADDPKDPARAELAPSTLFTPDDQKMYGIMVLVMALPPYLSGWRGNPGLSLLMGNLYHLVATVVGIAFAWGSAAHIRCRMSGFGSSPETEIAAV